MPVLVSTDEQDETWLKGSRKEAFELARQFPADDMRIVQTLDGVGRQSQYSLHLPHVFRAMSRQRARASLHLML
jgi:putative SOS response-associated peptidase YedK